MELATVLLQATSANPMMSLLPLVLIFVVFYFFMIRPQMKRQKELKTYRDALQKGDRVVTTGGLYGKITEVSDTTIHMEIAPNVHVKVDKYAVLKDPTDLESQK
ncbi:MAG: preprotein translocase subunit YajC [Bacteroidales bacterium]|jgi:preprotein translocase subunit YajC|nr:preprotein translocase subunit YajC [Bacteroidales bacterium]